MGSSKTFNGVDENVFECVKASSAKEHGTVYEPNDGSSGTATTKTIVGTVKLDFSFNPEKKEITYTIKDKPFLAPENEIWSGISNAIHSCGGGENS